MKKERFGRLRFRVDQLKLGDNKIDLMFPALCDNNEFRAYTGYNRDALIKYIVFLYDPNSDLVDEFENLQNRKDAAAIEAGYERGKSGDWPSAIMEIMELKNDQARAMILRFLKTIHNHVWTEICLLEQELDVYNAMRMEPLPVDTKKDSAELLAKRDNLMAMCEKRVRALELHKLKFYADHDDLREKAEDEFPITPENAVEMLKMNPN